VPPAADARRRAAGLVAGRRILRRAPKGFAAKQLPAFWMRVPWDTFQALDAGAVTQVRIPAGGRDLEAYAGRLPIGVVFWTMNPVLPSVMRARLFTVTENRLEPLGNASDRDVAREGFASREAWRHHWMEANRSFFDPLMPTEVFGLRDFHETDTGRIASMLLQHFYGHWLDGRRKDIHVPA
jgi:hypothetical protein